MLCRFTPLARPMPTRGQGELAGRAQVSVSGRSPVLACFLEQCWDYCPEPGGGWGRGEGLVWCCCGLPLGAAEGTSSSGSSELEAVL